MILFTALQGWTQTVSERLQNLGGLLRNSTQQEFLHPDEAFILNATVVNPELLRMHVSIVDGYYLYHDKFNFEIIEGEAAIDQDAISIPPGYVKEDPSFGSVEVNIGALSIDVPLKRTVPGEATLTLQYGYQGCKDNSLCYPPIKKTASLLVPAQLQGSTGRSGGNAVGIAAQQAPAGMVSEQDSFTRKLIGGGIILNSLLFFGAGLLLSLTPCVFPMIPILSGIIVGQGKRITPAKGFTLSLVYVLAMALTYAVIGVMAALAGVNVQAAAQNIWVITIFSMVFVALALSMFGFYDIQIPASLQDKLTRISNSQEKGKLSGVAIMGAVSAVIVGPCVAPPLVGALAYISQTGDELLGGMALFAMGMGMGVPLLIIGGSAGSVLPRVGPWMDTIKKIFGVGLLALAIWFMSRVISDGVELYLWGGLFIVTAIYMGALDQLERGKGWPRLWKGLGLIMLIYGVLLLIGASSGSGSLSRPLHGVAFNGSTSPDVQHLTFTPIKTVADLDTELQRATSISKPVMLDFYADWCIECIRMESTTFTDPKVHMALNDVILLQADVTANDDEDKGLLKRFGIYGPPAILFFNTQGQERSEYRLYGYFKAPEFINHVRATTGTSL
jgi:thiol:disulfide interchange protein DsbD